MGLVMWQDVAPWKTRIFQKSPGKPALDYFAWSTCLLIIGTLSMLKISV